MMELINNVLIEMVGEDVKPIELGKHIAKNYCSFDETELALIDVYWDIAFDKGWIYVSPDMIENMFGYTASKNMMTDFDAKLKKEYKINLEYEIVYDLIENRTMPDNLKKYYIINDETFKGLLFSSTSAKGKQNYKYYLKIEQLCKITTRAMLKCLGIRIKKIIDAETELKNVAS